jgi:hypothetical protein
MIPMETNPAQNDARKARHKRKLRGATTCARCGEKDLAVLVDPEKCSGPLHEVHHVAGRENSKELTVTLCRNCHAKLTEGLRDAGVDMTKPETLLHQVVNILKALAKLFQNIGKILWDLAVAIAKRLQEVRHLDPVWTELVSI